MTLQPASACGDSHIPCTALAHGPAGNAGGISSVAMSTRGMTGPGKACRKTFLHTRFCQGLTARLELSLMGRTAIDQQLYSKGPLDPAFELVGRTTHDRRPSVPRLTRAGEITRPLHTGIEPVEKPLIRSQKGLSPLTSAHKCKGHD